MADRRSADEPSDHDRWITVLLAVTSFSGSALLFSVEPMIARMLLPELGGSPAVWNTALVFFQVALLAGYGWAHVLLGRLSLRRSMVVQVVAFALGAIVLPVGLPTGWEPPAGSSPTTWTLAAMAIGVGAPFVAVSTLSPTLQHWLASTRHRDAHDPYFLYGAGNAGSLVALLAYPFVLEPSLGLQAQARLWSVGFGLTLGLLVLCAVACSHHRAPVATTTAGDAATPHATAAATAVTMASRLRWLVLAAVPSALLAGVTRHLATDVASIPLLWVVPLSLYLATFIAAFGRRSAGWTRLGTTAARPLAILAVVDALATILAPLPSLGLHLATFAAIAMAAHGRLAAARPPAVHLTGYYLGFSFGGVVGSVAAVLVAPVVFESVLEYPLAILVAVLLLPRGDGAIVGSVRTALPAIVVVVAALGAKRLGTDATTVIVLAALATGGALLMRYRPAATLVALAAVAVTLLRVDQTGEIYAERTFFGVTRVQETDQFRELISGTTMHGRQALDDPDGRRPLAYYAVGSPISQIIDGLRAGGSIDLGVIGLGAGSLAAYGEAGDRLTFYEIDPAVVRVAEDPALFGFLSSTAAYLDVQLGDGRKLVERADGARHHALVIDAFSSDAIPVHLLTREALEVYRDHLDREGVVAIHVSNRFFDLVPALAALADDAGWEARVNRWDPPAGAAAGAASTAWVVLGPRGTLVDGLERRGGWTLPTPEGQVWTDDHVDLLATLTVTG